MDFLLPLVGLFASALVAATILPAQSEAVLVALLVTEHAAPWLLVAVASVGNVLGAVINWLIGVGAERSKGRWWFPVGPASLDRAQRWYHRYGRWSLLFSWVPIIGDPLTVVAGVMREPLRSFIPLVAIGKVGRYAILALVAQGLL